ncbi:Signal recognition particle subunit SRP54 1 [Cardamine amara subsp. amara]|uniref:Signal recognition particle subunit SRP54 1 n=1 Tax=Cardamine amara subsp. amara TaxID=228776 RepID=A0ABD1B7A6_CARAN
MVFDGPSDQIRHSMQRMHKATLLDEVTMKICLIQISPALLDADVPTVLVNNKEINIQKFFNDLPDGCKDGKIFQRAAFKELCKMLDPGKSGLVLQKNESRVIMFIGLHGSEKDTVCVKYARYHQRMSFKPALVCADTFKPGALDRLNNLAAKAKVPVYGSYVELNSAKVASQGIEMFRRENRDLIIVFII